MTLDLTFATREGEGPRSAKVIHTVHAMNQRLRNQNKQEIRMTRYVQRCQINIGTQAARIRDLCTT